jgi:hypothetical protein
MAEDSEQYGYSAKKQQKQWTCILGAVLAIVILLCVWCFCAFKVIEAVNGDEPQGSHIDRRK